MGSGQSRAAGMLVRGVAGALVGVAACGAWAQQEGKREGEKKAVALESMPPPLRLGVRVNLVERQFRVIPTVVLAPDEASYLAAIEGWNTGKTGAVRYPVLIDDGMWAGRQRIAKFVRAFGPRSVVRWKAGAALGKLPEGVEARQKRIENAAASAWGVQTAGDLRAQWEKLGFAPPGVVVCTTRDPAWTAGVALAAFHGQPMLWIDPPHCPDPNAYMMLEQGDEFNGRIMGALKGSGRAWKALGDEIEAVTLCMTTPSRAWLGPSDKRKFLAVTDLVGRTDERSGRERWAWCGQIMGDGARAAYDAMCGLFLRPERAWLFDGYDSSPGWNAFDMTAAGEELGKIGVRAIVDDGPTGRGLLEWRSRGAGVREGPGAGMGIDVGLVAVNTSGNAEFFDLKPGQGKPVDVPILRRPTMVYFVHSFSLAQPTNRETVGGMWMDRGAYAYVGSVEEPYLQAFVPTPLAMARLAGGAPWGAAMRMDGGLGARVLAVGAEAVRWGGVALPLLGGEDVEGTLPDLLRTKDLRGALWALALVGRDGDAARLLAAALKEKETVCTPEVALAGIGGAFAGGGDGPVFGGGGPGVPRAGGGQRGGRGGVAEVRDMVWHATWPSQPRTSEEERVLLNAYARPGR